MNSKDITKIFKGKVVKEIVLNATWDSGRKQYYHNPRIVFTDGTVLGFYVQETDAVDYGIGLSSRALPPESWEEEVE